MPNSKGGVPMYNEQAQYNATISPQVPQGSPAMAGTQVAKEMAGYGDAMSKFGEKLVDYAVKRQQQEDDNYIMRRENDMRKQLNDLLYNPNNGLANQKLHNAKGTTMAFDDAAEKLTQQFMNDVNNPYLQAKFQSHVAQWLPSYRKNIAMHEGEETFNARKLDNATNMKDKVDASLINPGRQSTMNLLNELQANRDYMINDLGLSPEAANEEIQKSYSEGVLMQVQKLQGLGDTQGIMDVFDEAHGKVSGDTETKIAVMAGKTTVKMDAQKIVEKYKSDPRCFVNGVFSAALAEKYARQDNVIGEGARKKRKRWVGGAGSYFGDSAVNSEIDTAAKEFKIDPRVVAAVASVESNGAHTGADGTVTTSSAGALGIMQLMPDTAAGLEVNPTNRADNIRGGAKYLSQLIAEFGFSTDEQKRKVFAAYNAGPQAVRDYGGVPPYAETQSYVNKCMDALNGYEKSSSGSGQTISNHTFYTVKPGKEQEVVNLTHDTWVKLQALSAAYERQFGNEPDYEPFYVTAAGSTSGHNPGSKHYSMEAFDIAMDSLKRNPERFKWLEENARKYGLKPLNEYNGYGNEQYADGENFHFSNNGTPVNEADISAEVSQGSGGGRWVEEEVSNYNPLLEAAVIEGFKREQEGSTATKKQGYASAKNEILGLVKTGRLLPSDVYDIAKNIGAKYNLTEQDVASLASAAMSNRLDLADEADKSAREQRAFASESRARTRTKWGEEDAMDNFFEWSVNHPNASEAEIDAALSKTPYKFQYQVRKSMAKGEKSWFNDEQCKAAFNNAIAQAGNKGDQKTNAMLRLNALEDELVSQGKRLTPGMIKEEIAKMNVEQTYSKGIIFDDKAKLIDAGPGQSPIETGMPVETDSVGRSYVEVDDDVVGE